MDLTGAAWRKSSYSGNGGATCVEVAAVHGSRVIAVRDSKDPDGRKLVLTPQEWKAFTHHVKDGRFDLA